MAPVTYAINGHWQPKGDSKVIGKFAAKPPRPIDATPILAEWVSEAIFLFDRAYKCLVGALEKEAKEGCLPRNIEEILSDSYSKNSVDLRKLLSQ